MSGNKNSVVAKPLNKYLQKKLSCYLTLFNYLYSNRKEIKQKHLKYLKNEDDAPSFHDDPENYIPSYLYKEMSSDIVDHIQYYLDSACKDNHKITFNSIVDHFLGF